MIELLSNWCVTAAAATGVVVAVVIIKAYRYVHEFRNIFKEIGLHELPDTRWYGAWSYYMKKDDLFQLEIDLIKEHGKVYGYFEGRQPMIMMGDTDLLKHVMLKDSEHFYDRRIIVRIGENSPVDLQLVALTGARWKHNRQQLTPAFTPASLRRMEPLLQKAADQFAANMGKQADAKQTVNIKDSAGCFTMDAIASVAFAIEIDSFNHPNNPFVTQAKTLFVAIPINGSFVASFLIFPDFFNRLLGFFPKSMIPFAKTFLFFQEIIEKEIARRRETEQQVQRQDFLAHVIPLEKDAKDPANKPYIDHDEQGRVWLRNGLSKEEILSHASVFFFAGYEATANTIALAIFALCQHQDVQEKLYQELAKTFTNGKEVTLEALHEIKYLEMVINETLRCYTPQLRVDRICTSETVYNGMRIPKGVAMVIPINAIHHDPDLWPEPEKFDPERFSSENVDRIPHMAFIPFGAGNRNCIGMRLAMIEIRLAIARLILEFKFTLAPEMQKELPIRWLPSQFRVPHTPFLVVPERRSPTISS